MAETTGKNTKSALEAAVSDDGSGLVLTRELARVLEDRKSTRLNSSHW